MKPFVTQERQMKMAKKVAKKMTTKKVSADDAEEAVDKVREIVKFQDLEGKFLHIKVGDPGWGSDILEPDKMQVLAEEIGKAETQILKLFEDNDISCLAWVTHCFIDVRLVESSRRREGSESQ